MPLLRNVLLGVHHPRMGLTLWISILGFAVGCGSGPRLFDLPGSITVDGQPAVGATLMFHSTNKADEWVPTANVDAEGKFKVITDTKPGIPAGKYKITLTWPDPSKVNANAIASGSTDDPPDLLNGAYATIDRSPLSVDVASGMKELPPIEIKTK